MIKYALTLALATQIVWLQGMQEKSTILSVIKHQEKLQSCIDILTHAGTQRKKTKNEKVICFIEPVQNSSYADYITIAFNLSNGTIRLTYDRWIFDQKMQRGALSSLSSINCSLKLFKAHKLNTLYVEHVATLLPYQRQGFATQLLTSLWPKLQKAGYQEVRLYSMNHCIKLYEKQQFYQIVKNHKYPPLTAMRKQL